MPAIFKETGYRLKTGEIIVLSDSNNKAKLIIEATQTGFDILNSRSSDKSTRSASYHARDQRFLKVCTSHGIPDTIFPVEEYKDT